MTERAALTETSVAYLWRLVKDVVDPWGEMEEAAVRTAKDLLEHVI